MPRDHGAGYPVRATAPEPGQQEGEAGGAAGEKSGSVQADGSTGKRKILPGQTGAAPSHEW